MFSFNFLGVAFTNSIVIGVEMAFISSLTIALINARFPTAAIELSISQKRAKATVAAVWIAQNSTLHQVTLQDLQLGKSELRFGLAGVVLVSSGWQF
jgi:hypothetical protein